MRGRIRRRPEEKPYGISLTSLMDIVTNLLVYTIKIFAISPILVQDPSVVLPLSTTQENAEESVVVMVTGTQKIVVDGKVVGNLKKELLEIKQNQQGFGFTGQIVIVADKLTPYRVLVDVLATCAEAGFGKFEFAVVKQEA